MDEQPDTQPVGRADLSRLLAEAVAAVVAQQTMPPLLLSQAEAIQFTGLSRAGFFRLKAADRLPKPVRVEGVGVRYRRRDLEAWAEKLKASTRRRGTCNAE